MKKEPLWIDHSVFQEPECVDSSSQCQNQLWNV